MTTTNRRRRRQPSWQKRCVQEFVGHVFHRMSVRPVLGTLYYVIRVWDTTPPRDFIVRRMRKHKHADEIKEVRFKQWPPALAIQEEERAASQNP